MIGNDTDAGARAKGRDARSAQRAVLLAEPGDPQTGQRMKILGGNDNPESAFGVDVRRARVHAEGEGAGVDHGSIGPRVDADHG